MRFWALSITFSITANTVWTHSHKLQKHSPEEKGCSFIGLCRCICLVATLFVEALKVIRVIVNIYIYSYRLSRQSSPANCVAAWLWRHSGWWSGGVLLGLTNRACCGALTLSEPQTAVWRTVWRAPGTLVWTAPSLSGWSSTGWVQNLVWNTPVRSLLT